MEAWRERLLEEANSLEEKYRKLSDFIVGDMKFVSLDWADKVLLRAQRDAMNDYLTVLRKRIDRI